MQQNFYKNVFIKIKIRLVMFSNLNSSSFQHIRSKFESTLYFIEYTLIYRKIRLNIIYSTNLLNFGFLINLYPPCKLFSYLNTNIFNISSVYINHTNLRLNLCYKNKKIPSVLILILKKPNQFFHISF